MEILVSAETQTYLRIGLIRQDSDTVTAQLSGELDMTNTKLTSLALDRAGSDRRYVRLDLSGLAFCDCAGIRVVVDAHNRQLARGGTVILTGLTPTLSRLLAISHLGEALLIADGGGPPRAHPRCHLAAAK